MTAIERRTLLQGLAVCAACATTALRAQDFDLQALMERMAQRKSGQARFTEERFVQGIEGPLRASGTLFFAAPDRFERHTLQPLKESMELHGRTLLLRRGGRTRQLEVDAVPELGALLEALRGTLGGDAKALEKHFHSTLSGSQGRWVLRLQPRQTQLARQLAQIEIVGQGIDLRSIALQMPGGDRSLMLVEPLPGPPDAPRPASAAAPR